MQDLHVSTADKATAVFLSYSRRDSVFLHRLATALEGYGYRPIFDKSQRHHDDPDLRLTAQDEWWTALKAMIAASDVMVFVVTPDSAASQVCDDEIAHARSLGKRVIAVRRREIDFDTAPERLRALNIVLDARSDEPEAFAGCVDALCAELEHDIEWHRRGSRFTRQADQWDRDGRPSGQLLRAGAIEEADSWATRRPHDSDLGALVLEFLDASRSFERSERDRQRRTLIRGFVAPIIMAMRDGHAEGALRALAAAAELAKDPGFELDPPNPLWRAGARIGSSRVPLGVFRGHSSSVFQLTWSPDGEHIATCSSDGTARVWSQTTFHECASFGNRKQRIDMAAWSPDGRTLALAAWNEGVRIWRARSGESDVVRRDVGPIRNVAWAPNGTLFATADTSTGVCIWEVETWTDRLRTDATSRVVLWSPDGRRVATFGDDVKIWDFENGSQIAACPVNDVLHAEWCPDGMRIVATTLGGRMHVLDAENGAEISVSNATDFVRHATWSPDGVHLAVALEDGVTRLLDSRGIEVQRFAGHKDRVEIVAWSHSGTRVATGGHDQTVRIWDPRSGAELARFVGHEAWVEQLAWSPDETRLASGSYDDTARVWDTRIGDAQCKFYVSEHSWALAWAPGGELLAVPAGADARVHNARTGAEAARLVGHTGSVGPIAWSPDGKRLASASNDGTARVWSATGTGLVRLTGHTDRVWYIAWSADGTRIATASNDQTVRLWQASNGTEEARYSSSTIITAVAWSPDGTRLAVALDDESVLLIDVRTGRPLAVHQDADQITRLAWSHDGSRIATISRSPTAWVRDATTWMEVASLSHNRRVTDIGWSPDGFRIATASEDGTARIWNPQTSAELARLDGHEDAVVSISWAPDSGRVATGSGDRTARVWHAATGAELARLIGHNDRVVVVVWAPDGRRLATRATDNTARVWDVARTALAGDPRTYVAAWLAYGVGQRSWRERSDLLMQDAPDDLFAPMVDGMDREQRAEVDRVAALLRIPGPPELYVVPPMHDRPTDPSNQLGASAKLERVVAEEPVRPSGLGWRAALGCVMLALLLGRECLSAASPTNPPPPTPATRSDGQQQAASVDGAP